MTMTYRKLDANHDPVYGSSKLDFLTGVDAVAQAIKTRLLLLLGEWWENQDDGLPLWQSMLGAYGARKEVLDRLVVERITGTENVTKVTQLESTLENRAYTFSCEVDTTFGKVTVTNQGAA